ncbi:MAG: response regulator [Clostridia bacterium]|nr:response regulator [Clostridia bacterium]
MYEVIIVEDDPMVAMINKQYVNQNAHFHVATVCKDGISAMEYMRAHTVHLAILDVFMPRISGMELLRQIRAEKLPVEVIMVTAANDSATLDEALRLGIIDYLVKPFVNARFQAALEKFMAQKNAFQDLSSLNQQNIDFIMESAHRRSAELYPKGIQDKTLEIICNYLRDAAGAELTSEEIADKVGLSRVTVRRYMNHLLEKGDIVGRMNYETGGRPCMVYQWNK